MARRAAAARRRRQIQAGIAGAVAVVLVVLGSWWLINELRGDPAKKDNTAKPAASKTPGACEYKDLPKEGKSKERKDVGRPEAGAEARQGVRLLTLNTNRGAIKIQLDAEKAPCNTESISYLTGKKFYDGSPCHRLTTQGLSVLQCGDPTGTGRGGPAYTTNDENLPIKQKPAYPKGVVAMANSGPATNGSQFFIVYDDTQLDPNYTIVGEVVEGMDIVEKVAKAGVKGKQPGDGAPKLSVEVKTATVTEPQPKDNGAAATDPSKS